MDNTVNLKTKGQEFVDSVMEAIRENFKRIATYRTNKIIDQIRTLSKCSNKNSYSYTEEDINKIFSRLEEELKEAKSAFCGEAEGGKFSL